MTSNWLKFYDPEESYYNMNNNEYENFLKLILHSPQYLGHLAMEIQVLDEIKITKKLIQTKGLAQIFSVCLMKSQQP